MKKSVCSLGLFLALIVPDVEAVNREIRATFQPDPSQPSKNVFINKTPNSGYCATYPGECEQHNMFSIQLPVRFSSTRALYQGEVIPIKVPANWRRLTVTNTETQETETVEVRITGIGSNYVLSHPAHELVGISDVIEGHRKLWTSSSWVYAPAPCQYSGVGAYGPAHYRFFWKTPAEESCVKRTAYPIPSMYFETLDFAYELRTPNPLGMSSGLYTGSIPYTLGSLGDFDLGPLMTPDDANLTLDFVLDVQHTLKVDLPPGGNKVALEPEGGWQRWLANGRKPTRIYRDQQFYISSSSRFKVRLECEVDGLFDCMLVDPVSRRSAAVQLSITLPNGMTGTDEQPIKRRSLRSGHSNAIEVQPSIYVDRKPGTLHFEISPSYINFIVQPGSAANYVGNLTVIWDSEA